jgi:uncharacterized SAM-binding protein YcdF (DUF218 family)
MDKLTKWMGRIALVGGVAMLLSSCLTLGAGKTYKRFVAHQPYDAIIVPGVPFENGTWSDVMKMRVHWAIHLYKKGMAKNIIFSGSAVYSPYVESKIMALYALELGVPKENIYTEEQAEHSSENLYYSYKIAKNNGMDKVALATDPFQGSFLRGFASKIMLDDLGFLPIVFDTLSRVDQSTPEIDPSSAFIHDFVAITEREDIGTRFMGTMGKFIKFEEGDDPKTKQKRRKK